MINAPANFSKVKMCLLFYLLENSEYTNYIC